MKKDKELIVFQKVFGTDLNGVLSTSERPDFLIPSYNGFQGVEITELYEDQTSARILNVPGYMKGLFSGERDVLKIDENNIVADEITVRRGGGAETFKMRVIIRDKLKNISELVAVLQKNIDAKNEKISSYLSNCSAVDLVIEDSGHLFSLLSSEQLINYLSTLQECDFIKKSEFREIYLIKPEEESESILPLKGAIFFADLSAFEHIIIKENLMARVDELILLEALSNCLLESGHDNFFALIDKDIFVITYGAWQIKYANNQKNLFDFKFNFNNYSEGKHISKLRGSIHNEAKEISKNLILKRYEFRAYLDIQSPTFTAQRRPST